MRDTEKLTSTIYYAVNLILAEKVICQKHFNFVFTLSDLNTGKYLLEILCVCVTETMMEVVKT